MYCTCSFIQDVRIVHPSSRKLCILTCYSAMVLLSVILSKTKLQDTCMCKRELSLPHRCYFFCNTITTISKYMLDIYSWREGMVYVCLVVSRWTPFYMQCARMVACIRRPVSIFCYEYEAEVDSQGGRRRGGNHL